MHRSGHVKAMGTATKSHAGIALLKAQKRLAGSPSLCERISDLAHQVSVGKTHDGSQYSLINTAGVSTNCGFGLSDLQTQLVHTLVCTQDQHMHFLAS